MSSTADALQRLAARLERERATRLEAERCAEEATRELYRTRELLRLQSRVAATANEARDLERALVSAMDAIREHTGWPVAHAWLRRHEGGQLRDTGLWRGEPSPPALRAATAKLVLREGSGLTGRVLASGRPQAVPELSRDPGFQRTEQTVEAGLRSGIAFPIVARNGEVAGVLEFFTAVPATPAEDFLGVLAQVGAQLGRVVDRVRAERALYEALQELERSNAELETFAYAASHDLREPLRTIEGFAQLLARRYEGKLDAPADEFLHHILQGVQRMQQLVNDLLTLSRAGRGPARRDRVDLGVVTQEALDALCTAVDDTCARVMVGPLPQVVGDAGQFRQVLQNLLANALKFRGGDPPFITVQAEREQGGWCLAVTDEGIGIDPAKAEQIFEMFHRETTEEDVPGSGLGLSICRRIVEHHGGRIWAEPGPGSRGSRFCVLFADGEPAAGSLASARPSAPATPRLRDAGDAAAAA
ncbi:MAG TPA: ATP-binding protein [Baekduia sp.]|nr:ATP-binding protein [Baekduia sp.]